MSTTNVLHENSFSEVLSASTRYDPHKRLGVPSTNGISCGGASAVLAERFGVCAEPGRKCECPFCHHKTFSVKRDDTIAKCFHPDCGRFITPYGDDGDRRLRFVLDEVFRDWHAALMKQRGKSGSNAYNYCTHERKIHPHVVADSWLGVVPTQYDVDAKFAPEVGRLKTMLSELAGAETQTKVDRQKVIALREKIRDLEAVQSKLQDCVGCYQGWLAFFYTDAQHHVTLIKFRQPYTKNIRLFKPTEATGLFNHGLFRPATVPGTTDLNGDLIVLEGEFNTLQLQTLCAREQERKGLPANTGYVFSCAVGGVKNADVKTIQSIAANPIICYDNDASGAGFELVEALREHMNVEAFTTPDVDSDLDSHIVSFGGDVAAAYATVQRLLAGRKPCYRPYSAIRAEVDQLRRSEGRGGLKLFEVARESAERIVADLEQRGKLYHYKESAYLFLNDDKRLIPIHKDDVQLQLLLQRYGVAPSDSIAKSAIDALYLAALDRGTETEVHPFAYYDRDANTLYLYNLGLKVYRITTQGYDTVDNGTDGVLFVSNPNWAPFELAEPADSGLLQKHVLAGMRCKRGGLSPEDCTLLFLTWFYTLFFPQLFPTKVIPALVGEHGSGKSMFARRIGQLLFGPGFNVTPLSKNSQDFDAAITNNPLVVIDNADSKCDWLEDRMAVAATGGTLRLRELYTTNKQMEYPIRANLMVTSRTPPFRREDIADRLLLLNVERLELFAPEASLTAEFHQKRNAIMAEVVGQLQEVLQALEIASGKTYTTRFRMADFADFALKIAHAQGWGARMESIFEALREEQGAFAMDGEPLFELIEIWTTEKEHINVGRWVTTNELWSELNDTAFRIRMAFPYRTPRALGWRITKVAEALRSRFDMRDERGRGNIRKLSFVAAEPEPLRAAATAMSEPLGYTG